MPQQVREATLYLTIGALVSLFLRFVANLFLARVLGPDKFGLWGVVLASVTIAGSLLWQVSVAVEKYVAEHDGRGDVSAVSETIRYAFRVQVYMMMGFLAVAYALRNLLLRSFFDGIELLFNVFIGLTVLQVCGSFLAGVLRGSREAKAFAFRHIGQAIAELALLILGIGLLNLSLLGAALASTISWALLSLSMVPFSLQLARRGSFQTTNKVTLKEITSFTGFASVTALINYGIRASPPILVKTLGAGDTNEWAGFVVVLLSWSHVIDSIISTVVKAGLPYVSRWYAQGNIQMLRAYLRKIVSLLLLGYLAFLPLAFFFAHDLIELLYGPQYVPLVRYIVPATLAFLALSANFISRIVLHGIGHPEEYSYMAVVGLILYVSSVLCFRWAIGDILMAVLLSLIVSSVFPVVGSYLLVRGLCLQAENRATDYR